MFLDGLDMGFWEKEGGLFDEIKELEMLLTWGGLIKREKSLDFLWGRV